ncbi:HesA/MoeB/ThiF family protein [Candidatus Woesearchaeota archaeon]|jgi:molybdopterin/thiamine biosynthesis adenylyltransferase|nr:HesA/MoeB/ThiF family protein [Candidatus Woesearchaeota archaeon]
MSILDEIKRYKHSLFDHNDKSKSKSICIVGVGGLGTTAADMIVREGFKSIILIDDDIIELSNLQRQVLYDERDIGKFKVDIAKQKLLNINSSVKIKTHQTKITQDNIHLITSTLVLDCCDNIDTRFIINKFCYEENIPWVYTTVAGDHGFAKIITPESACLRCFYKNPKEAETSQNIGILNTAVHLASSIQVTLAFQYLNNKEYDNSLISFDIWNPKITKIKVKKNPNCKICGR